MKLSKNTTVILLLTTILAIAMLTLFTGLGRLTLYPWDEARFSEITYELTESHDWLNLSFNQRPYHRKPPLYFWLNSITFKALGGAEFASRFTTAFLGLLTVGMVFVMGKKMFDLTSATIASLVLLAIPMYFTEARMGMVDVTLTFFTTLALYFFYLSFSKDRYILLFFLFSGLAVMTKSAAGIIPLGVAGVYLLLIRDFTWLKNRYFYLGILLFLLVVAPWHIYQAVNNPTSLADSYFSREIVDRMVKPLDSHAGGFFFYFLVLASRTFPWSLVFLMGLIILFVEQKSKAATNFLTVWFFTIIITFSFFSTKNPPYILPLLPPMALFIGYFCQWHLKNSTSLSNRFFLGFNLVLTLMWAAVLVALVSFYLQLDLNILPRNEISMHLQMGWIIFGCLTLSLGAYCFAAIKGKPRFLLVYFIALSVGIIMTNLEAADLAVGRDPFKHIKAVAELSSKLVPNDLIIHSYKITCETVSFYSRHRVVEFEESEKIRQVTAQKNYYYILPQKDYRENRELFPNSQVIFQKGDIILITRTKSNQINDPAPEERGNYVM